VFIRTAEEQLLRDSALNQLEQLAKSDSEDVRHEASLALKKLHKRFP